MRCFVEPFTYSYNGWWLRWWFSSKGLLFILFLLCFLLGWIFTFIVGYISSNISLFKIFQHICKKSLILWMLFLLWRWVIFRVYKKLPSTLLVLSLGSSCSGSLKWFLIKKSSQLSPMFLGWVSIKIYTRSWWYKEFFMNCIFLCIFLAIFIKLLGRKYGKLISFPSRKFIIKNSWWKNIYQISLYKL